MARSTPIVLAGSILIVLAGLLVGGCENTPLTGPEDGELRVSASPLTVIIDEAAGETEGTSTIAAQLFDASGRAMVGAEVIFATSAGTLASGGPPNSVETDSSGIAIDVLTLGVADDATVEVSAISGKLSGSETITKKLSQGNVPPTANIVASPAQAQRKGRTVVFDGRTSTDPDGPITCYQWEVDSTDNSRDEIVQGTTQTTLNRSYPVEQTLTVILRVSDDPDAATTFCTATPAPTSNFNGLEDFINDYEIVCDLTPPLAAAGPDQVVQGPTVSVTFDGSGSTDPDSGITTYRWDCGNGQAVQSGTNPVVQCNYTNNGSVAQTFSATLTVTNSCNDTDEDRVNATVLPQ